MNSKVKVIIAVVCLAAAGILVAMNMGLFGSGRPARQGTANNNANQSTGTTQTDGSQPADETAPAAAGQLKKDNF